MLVERKAVVFIILIIIAASCKNSVKKDETVPATSLNGITEKKAGSIPLYGIPADSFYLISGHIKPNTFISDLLVKHGVSMQDIDKAIRGYSTVFDVRKIRSGSKYILYCERDSNAKARYLVYEHSPATCYVFSFNDSINITSYTKQIRREIRFSSGTIETSLWDAMIGEGLHPKLVSDLSDIFAWSVDFFGLQKGDNFKVIYEELFIDNNSLGTDRIYGAQFNRSGTVINAIPFIQNGVESFFGSDGNSLRKAFLKAPLQFSRISSRFSSGRMHPILRIIRPHYGVDYAAPVGTEVHSIGDGTVISAGDSGGAGKMVKIQHNSIYATAYLHLSRFAPGIAPGVKVKQNDIIGYVGSSGLSTGPHLDFRFYKGGYPVDPFKVDAPSVEPVSKENSEKFEKIKSVILALLGTIN
jgi:murein DD-endopeptidase MepM/ murein hydrolase activator NlpD